MDTLVVVDMQNDFITGALGTKAAQEILPKVTDYVKGFKGNVVCTMDNHFKGDMLSIEWEKFGTHCVENTVGIKIPQELEVELNKKNAVIIEKNSFMPLDDGFVALWEHIFESNHPNEYDRNTVYVCGVTTDICVLNTALYLRSHLPYYHIVVLSNLCAGTSSDNHQKALDLMEINCIEVETIREVL